MSSRAHTLDEGLNETKQYIRPSIHGIVCYSLLDRFPSVQRKKLSTIFSVLAGIITVTDAKYCMQVGQEAFLTL